MNGGREGYASFHYQRQVMQRCTVTILPNEIQLIKQLKR